MDQRTMARLAAVQAIYALELNAETKNDAKHLLDVNQQKRMNRKNFDVIIANVEANKAEIETLIAANLSEEWKFERLDKILKAILSAAIAEIKYSDAEKNLIISEYVSIADSFYGGDEPKFVNAVLDKIN